MDSNAHGFKMNPNGLGVHLLDWIDVMHMSGLR